MKDFSNVDRIRDLAKNIARKANVPVQTVLQTVMMERFLERMFLSKYAPSFVAKGGFLLASLMGLNRRTTQDLDATLRGYPLSESVLHRIAHEIISVDLDDGVQFVLQSIRPIRKHAAYTGQRLTLWATMGEMEIHVKLDITSVVYAMTSTGALARDM